VLLGAVVVVEGEVGGFPEPRDGADGAVVDGDAALTPELTGLV